MSNGDQPLRSPWNHQQAAGPGPAASYSYAHGGNGYAWRLPYDNTLPSPSGSAPALSFPTDPPPAPVESAGRGTGIYLLVSMLMAVMLATVAFVAWRHGTRQTQCPASAAAGASTSSRPLTPSAGAT